MAEGNADAVRLLGLRGFVVLGVTEIGGELELIVETDQTVVGCRGCGVRAVSHGRRETVVRDLPIAGRPTRLRWRKRLGAVTSGCVRRARGPNDTPRSPRVRC